MLQGWFGRDRRYNLKDKRIANFINTMNYFVGAGITYYTAAKYSYENRGILAYNEIPLVFLCWQKYKLNHKQRTHEAVPFDKSHNHSFSELAKFPAYLKLLDSLVTILKLDSEDIGPFLSWLFVLPLSLMIIRQVNIRIFENEFSDFDQ